MVHRLTTAWLCRAELRVLWSFACLFTARVRPIMVDVAA